MDGTQVNGSRVGGMSESKTWARTPKLVHMSQKRKKWTTKSIPVSPKEHSRINSQLGGGCGDHL